MASHSSILAWRIPWTEKLGRPQSMGHRELDMTATNTVLSPRTMLSILLVFSSP